MKTSTDAGLFPQTLDEFLAWQPNDGFKYEWNDGEIIRFESMKRKHLLILRTLGRLFDSTEAYQKGGALISEQDVWLTGIQLRRPDLAYFSGEQIDNSLSVEEEPIPAFAIEVISPTDDAVKVDEKVAEYFKAGVQVVWHIYPETEAVYVYTSRRNVGVCVENDICSARPVMPDFEISVNDLFAAPGKR